MKFSYELIIRDFILVVKTKLIVILFFSFLLNSCSADKRKEGKIFPVKYDNDTSKKQILDTKKSNSTIKATVKQTHNF